MQYEVSQFEHIQYVTRYPNGYEPWKKYPVIMFFHGAGTRGNDVDALIKNPYFGVTDKYAEQAIITIAPLCSTDTWFDMYETLVRLAIKTSRETFTDSKRIYAMGASGTVTQQNWLTFIMTVRFTVNDWEAKRVTAPF